MPRTVIIAILCKKVRVRKKSYFTEYKKRPSNQFYSLSLFLNSNFTQSFLSRLHIISFLKKLYVQIRKKLFGISITTIPLYTVMFMIHSDFWNLTVLVIRVPKVKKSKKSFKKKLPNMHQKILSLIG